MTRSTEALHTLPVAALALEGVTVVAANELAGELLRIDGDALVGTSTLDLFDGTPSLEQGTSRWWLGRVDDRPNRFVELSCAGPDRGGNQVVVLRDVTEEATYERLAYHAGQSIIVLDQDGTLVRRFFGRLDPAEEADIIGESMLSRLHPEDLVEIIEGAAWLTEGPGRRLRTTARARGNADPESWQFLAVDAIAALDDPHLNGFVAYLNLVDEDIPRTPLGKSVGTSLAELVPIGIVVSDQGGHVVYANRLAHDLLDRPGDTGSAPWFDALPDDSRELVLDLLTAARRGAPGAIAVRGNDGWLRIAARSDRIGDTDSTNRPFLSVVTIEELADNPFARNPDVVVDAVFEAAPPLAVVDTNRRIVRVNRSLTHLFGQRAEIGTVIDAWVEDGDARHRLLEWARHPSESELPLRVIGAAGALDAVLAGVAAIDRDGIVHGAVITVRPATEHEGGLSGSERARRRRDAAGVPGRHHAMTDLAHALESASPVVVVVCSVVDDAVAADEGRLSALTDRLDQLGSPEGAVYRLDATTFLVIVTELDEAAVRSQLAAAVAPETDAVRVALACAPTDGTDGPTLMHTAMAALEHASVGGGA